MIINPCHQVSDLKHMYDLSDIGCNDKKSYPDGSLMKIINSDKDFSIFTELIKKAKYESKLSNDQTDFTIFVPSDKHIKNKYSIKYLHNIDDVLARQIIKASMIDRKIDKNLLQSSPISTFPTMNKSRIKVKTIENITFLENNILVIGWNKIATNGLIHIIDKLIIPEH